MDRVLNEVNQLVDVKSYTPKPKKDERLLRLKEQFKKVSDELIKFKEGSYIKSLKSSLEKTTEELKLANEIIAELKKKCKSK